MNLIREVHLVYSDPIDKFDYEYVINKFKNLPDIEFNNSINILVVTTRLQGCAYGIYKGLKSYDFLNLDIATDVKTIENLLLRNNYDVMLIIGYLRYDYEYRIINIVEEDNVQIIMIARLDEIIEDICTKYNINYKLDRYYEIKNLPAFIKNITRKF